MLIIMKVIAVLVFLALILLPACLIIVSSVRFKGLSGGTSAYMILAAGVLFAVLSLDFLAPLFLTLALNFSAEELAETSVMLVYVKVAANYIALLLLGIGLWSQSSLLRRTLRDRNIDGVRID